MNKTSRERLSRDFVTRSAWLYEYRLYIQKPDLSITEPRPVSRGSYTRLTPDEILMLERSERSGDDWSALGIDEIWETPVVIGQSKPKFLRTSPILEMGERVKLNMES